MREVINNSAFTFKFTVMCSALTPHSSQTVHREIEVVKHKAMLATQVMDEIHMSGKGRVGRWCWCRVQRVVPYVYVLPANAIKFLSVYSEIVFLLRIMLVWTFTDVGIHILILYSR